MVSSRNSLIGQCRSNRTSGLSTAVVAAQPVLVSQPMVVRCVLRCRRCCASNRLCSVRALRVTQFVQASARCSAAGITVSSRLHQAALASNVVVSQKVAAQQHPYPMASDDKRFSMHVLSTMGFVCAGDFGAVSWHLELPSAAAVDFEPSAGPCEFAKTEARSSSYSDFGDPY